MEGASIEELIYEGDTIVYKGTYKNNPVAIKYMLYDAAENGDLMREARVAAEAAKYVATPNVHFFGQFFTPIDLTVAEDTYNPIAVTYFDWLQGATLQELVESGQMSERRKRHIARGMIKIVLELHKHGIVHGDLYLVNWMLADDVLYIIDFGGGSINDKPIVYDSIESYTLADALTNLKFGVNGMSEEDSPFQATMTIADLDKVANKVFHR